MLQVQLRPSFVGPWVGWVSISVNPVEFSTNFERLQSWIVLKVLPFLDLLAERKSWLEAEFYAFFRFLDVKSKVMISHSVSVQLMKLSRCMSWLLLASRFKAEYCDHNDVCCQNSLIVILADNVYRRLVRKRWAFIWPKSWFGMNVSQWLFSAEYVVAPCLLTYLDVLFKIRFLGGPW